MPTYEYRCKDCRQELEAQQSFSDDALTECPSCGGALKKKFSAVGISFKGSGFYKTDSRGSGAAGVPSSGSAGTESASGDASGKATSSSSSDTSSGSAESGSSASSNGSSSDSKSGSKSPKPSPTAAAGS